MKARLWCHGGGSLNKGVVWFTGLARVPGGLASSMFSSRLLRSRRYTFTSAKCLSILNTTPSIIPLSCSIVILGSDFLYHASRSSCPSCFRCVLMCMAGWREGTRKYCAIELFLCLVFRQICFHGRPDLIEIPTLCIVWFSIVVIRRHDIERFPVTSMIVRHWLWMSTRMNYG